MDRVQRFRADYLAHEGELRAFVGAFLHERLAREEVLRETARQLWAQYPPAEGFGAWSRAVASRQVLQQRRANPRLTLALSPECLPPLKEAFDVTEAPQKAEAALEEGLQRLPDRAAGVLSLRYALGASPAEAAQQLHLSAEAVLQTLARLRGQLVDDLQQRLLPGTKSGTRLPERVLRFFDAPLPRAELAELERRLQGEPEFAAEFACLCRVEAALVRHHGAGTDPERLLAEVTRTGGSERRAWHKIGAAALCLLLAVAAGTWGVRTWLERGGADAEPAGMAARNAPPASRSFPARHEPVERRPEAPLGSWMEEFYLPRVSLERARLDEVAALLNEAVPKLNHRSRAEIGSFRARLLPAPTAAEREALPAVLTLEAEAAPLMPLAEAAAALSGFEAVFSGGEILFLPGLEGAGGIETRELALTPEEFARLGGNAGMSVLSPGADMAYEPERQRLTVTGTGAELRALEALVRLHRRTSPPLGLAGRLYSVEDGAVPGDQLTSRAGWEQWLSDHQSAVREVPLALLVAHSGEKAHLQPGDGQHPWTAGLSLRLTPALSGEIVLLSGEIGWRRDNSAASPVVEFETTLAAGEVALIDLHAAEPGWPDVLAISLQKPEEAPGGPAAVAAGESTPGAAGR